MDKFKAKIKPTSKVMIDFSIYYWDEEDTVFECEYTGTSKERVNCVADGYGSKKEYGQGSVLTLAENLIPIPENPKKKRKKNKKSKPQ